MLATVLHRTHGYTGEMILGDGTALEFVNGQAGPTTITFADAQSLTVMGFAVVTTDTPSTGYDLFTDQLMAPVVASTSSATSAALANSATLKAAFVATVAAPTGVAATDTTNIQAVIDAATTAGGGLVLLRAGTYLVTTLTMKTGVVLRGQGRTSTIIKQANATNADVITSANFSTLTGTSVATLGGAPNGFAIEQLAVDGNKTNQTGTSWGIRVYGHSFRFDELHVHDCRSGGLYHEFSYSGGAFPAGSPSYEPRISAVDINHCDGWGWRHNGPTDLLASRVLVWKNGLDGLSGGIWVQSGNGTNLSQCHTYGNVGWSIVADAQVFITGCQIETGEKGNGNLDAGGLWLRFDNCVVSGGSIYRITAAGTPTDGCGLRLGDSGSSKFATLAFVNTIISGFTGDDAAHAAIHFSADAFSTVIATAAMSNPSGAASATVPITGTPDVNSRLQIQVTGSSTVRGLNQNIGTSTIGVKAVRSTDQTAFPSGTFTLVNFDGTDVWDTNGFHDPATNNTRITVPAGYAGKYRLQAGFPWVANTTGRRVIRFKKNGSTIVARDDRPAVAAGPTCINIGWDGLANVGDYFEVEVVHDSGGTLSSDIANGPIYFSAEFRG